MKKHFILYAAAALLCLSLPVHADWITAQPSDLTVQGGTASARLALTGTQSVRAALPSAEGSVMSLSFFSKDQNQPELQLDKIPLLPTPVNHVTSTHFSITPIIDSGNGQRYYLVQTGVPGGCLIIAYGNGSFQQVFSATSIPGNWAKAEVAPQKKNLLLTLTSEEGTVSHYQLAWDKKANIFQATVLQS